MTNRDRDDVAKRIKEIADRLAGAGADTNQRAVAYVDRAGDTASSSAKCAHQAGALEFICEQAAGELRSLLDYYLAPQKPVSSGTRRRR